MYNIKNFFVHNYKTILKVIAGLFLFYWIIFVLTPKTGLSAEQKAQLDSLNQQIKLLHEDNLRLENQIDSFNAEIEQVDKDINKIKGQKTIVKEIYHEKISNVDKLTVRELDSFFTDRYNK
jgi:peptidoglycan hydrolase CwlO-like protein